MRNHLTEHFEENHPGYFYCIQEAQRAPFKNLYYSFQTPPQKDLKDAAIAGDEKHEYQKPPEKATKCFYNKTARRYYGDQVSIDDGDVKHRFTLVSYHGHHNEEKTTGQMVESKKIDEIKEFFREMLHVAETHKMTVIIGGDFNLSLQKWKSKVEDIGEGKIEVADEYKVGELREGKDVIDTFAVVYPPHDITHTRCELIGKPQPVSLRKAVDDAKEMVGTDRALKHKKDERDLKDTEIENLYMIMDHDPVAITVKLKTRKTDPK